MIEEYRVKIAHYNKKSRQAKLLSRYENNDPNIKFCECGELFNVIAGNKTKDKCSPCSRKNPQVKVYVKELKKYVWVRIPKGANDERKI